MHGSFQVDDLAFYLRQFDQEFSLILLEGRERTKVGGKLLTHESYLLIVLKIISH